MAQTRWRTSSEATSASCRASTAQQSSTRTTALAVSFHPWRNDHTHPGPRPFHLPPQRSGTSAMTPSVTTSVSDTSASGNRTTAGSIASGVTTFSRSRGGTACNRAHACLMSALVPPSTSASTVSWASVKQPVWTFRRLPSIELARLFRHIVFPFVISPVGFLMRSGIRRPVVKATDTTGYPQWTCSATSWRMNCSSKLCDTAAALCVWAVGWSFRIIFPIRSCPPMPIRRTTRWRSTSARLRHWVSRSPRSVRSSLFPTGRSAAAAWVIDSCLSTGACSHASWERRFARGDRQVKW